MKIQKLAIAVLTFSIFLSAFVYVKINAAALTAGSVTISDSRPTTASVTYTIKFSSISLSAIKCIKVQFSDTAAGGSKPTNMDITSAALSGTSTYIPTPASWAISNNNTSGVSSITFASGETPAGASARTVVLTGITNGSVAGTAYYLLFSTYNNTDCSSSGVDSATIAYIYTAGQTLTATVDPTLTFTVAGVANGQSVNGATTTITTTSTTIPLGVLSTGANTIGAQDLAVGTNAVGGYTVTIRYTGVFTNGSHTFVDHSGTNASPTSFSAAATEALGYTTNDAVLGTGTAARFSSNLWAGLSTSPLEIAYNLNPASETTRVGYQAGIAATTPAGAYTTTIVYVATPTY